jgi:hypothetical protein
VNGKLGFSPIGKGGTKTNEGTEAGVYGCGTRRNLSVSLGQFTSLFQAEVYFIKTCALEIIDRGCEIRNMKLPIYWHDWDLNVHMLALNKHAPSQ